MSKVLPGSGILVPDAYDPTPTPEYRVGWSCWEVIGVDASLFYGRTPVMDVTDSIALTARAVGEHIEHLLSHKVRPYVLERLEILRADYPGMKCIHQDNFDDGSSRVAFVTGENYDIERRWWRLEGEQSRAKIAAFQQQPAVQEIRAVGELYYRLLKQPFGEIK